ncbi:MAG: histidine kinase [Bacteroidia bacterium]|nr:histidine kinase [Bacteroidia bacterium]
MKYHFRKLWVRILQYIGMTLLVLLWICRRCYADPSAYLNTIGFTFLITVLLFEGNGWINYWVGNKVSWVEKPVLRAVLGISSTIIYTSLLVVLMYMIVFIWGRGYTVDQFLGSLLETLWITMLITAVVTLLLHAREFLFHWREAALRVEKLKNEQINSRFASLKAQLNPHFLFNSLNALTALVYKDADQAALFIKKLSEMYRYILEYVDEEVVSLEKELECMDAYVFLLKIRHGEQLVFEVNIKDKESYVPPLSLQMLLENATKHNIISRKHALKIEVFTTEQGYLVVRNSYNPKGKSDYSLGKGLKNIKARYELLTDQEVYIKHDDSYFEVGLPLLQMD